jgi:drug/metabolite transporter (DMT)-like permease
VIATVVWAVVAAVGYGVASVLQAVGVRRSSGGPTAWVIGGLALDAGAWLASLVALRALPVVVVQALLAGSVVVTAVLARMVLAARLRRTDVWAIGLAVAGLVVLTGAAGPEPPRAATRVVVIGAYAWAAALVVAAVTVYRRGSSGVLAVLGGLGYSGTALAARAAHGVTGTTGTSVGGLLELVTQPLVVPLVVSGAVGVVAYLRALERGRVGPATAVMWATEVVVPGVIGLAVLGDQLRPGWAPAAAVATAVVVAACAVLATSPAGGAEHVTGHGG